MGGSRVMGRLLEGLIRIVEMEWEGLGGGGGAKRCGGL